MERQNDPKEKTMLDCPVGFAAALATELIARFPEALAGASPVEPSSASVVDRP